MSQLRYCKSKQYVFYRINNYYRKEASYKNKPSAMLDGTPANPFRQKFAQEQHLHFLLPLFLHSKAIVMYTLSPYCNAVKQHVPLELESEDNIRKMRIEIAGCSVQIKPFMQEQMKKIA